MVRQIIGFSMGEWSKKLKPGDAFLFALAGFTFFLFLERMLYWHHCHKDVACDIHAFTYLNIVGDGLHNFIDGMLIAASFIVSVHLGIATGLAVA